jgi:hypothetical protein
MAPEAFASIRAHVLAAATEALGRIAFWKNADEKWRCEGDERPEPDPDDPDHDPQKLYQHARIKACEAKDSLVRLKPTSFLTPQDWIFLKAQNPALASALATLSVAATDVEKVARDVCRERGPRPRVQLDLLEQAIEDLKRFPTAATPPIVPSNEADPVGEAIRLVEGSRRTVELIRYLAGRPERKAHLDTIAIDLYKVRQPDLRRRRPTVRQQVERTRDRLKGSGFCELVILDNVVDLIIVDESERPTKM